MTSYIQPNRSVTKNYPLLVTLSPDGSAKQNGTRGQKQFIIINRILVHFTA